MHTKPVNTFVTYPSIMPISRYRDNKIEEMYEQIDKVIKLLKGKDNMIFVGDWNAVPRKIKEQDISDAFELGKRNKKSEILIG